MNHRLRARLTPALSVLIGSALTLAPIIADAPLLPPFGLMMLLAWRLMRPVYWKIWAAAPFGLFDDLLSGQPPGSAVLLWSLIFLAIEAVDNRLVWRDYWQDWAIAAAAIAFALTGGWVLVLVSGGGGGLRLIVPQLLMSILLYPLTARIAARLDRWRLAV